MSKEVNLTSEGRLLSKKKSLISKSKRKSLDKDAKPPLTMSIKAWNVI